MTFKLTSLATVFDNKNIWETYSEPENFVQFKIDPLVLSCCSYRHNDPSKENYDPTAAFTSLNNPNYLYDKVNQEDFDLAEKIRKYYQGKLAWAKLRGKESTKFRKDLSTLVNLNWDETAKISENYFGMLYKLPYFYSHDQILDNEVFETTYQDIKQLVASKTDVTLTFIRSLDEYQKRNPSVKYWFKDGHENRFCISVEKHNSLIPSWEAFIQKPVTINGYYTERSYDSLHFYLVKPNWKIVT